MKTLLRQTLVGTAGVVALYTAVTHDGPSAPDRVVLVVLAWLAVYCIAVEVVRARRNKGVRA